MANRPDITLYTTQTPNGIKISIALEELGYVVPFPFLYDQINLWCGGLTLLDRLPYKVEKIDISKNTQKEPYVLH
jgi:glutathione S-transferase